MPGAIVNIPAHVYVIVLVLAHVYVTAPLLLFSLIGIVFSCTCCLRAYHETIAPLSTHVSCMLLARLVHIHPLCFEVCQCDGNIYLRTGTYRVASCSMFDEWSSDTPFACAAAMVIRSVAIHIHWHLLGMGVEGRRRCGNNSVRYVYRE